ncbi:MAG: cell division protein FtsQ/DivIB [Rhodoferax sp.]
MKTPESVTASVGVKRPRRGVASSPTPLPWDVRWTQRATQVLLWLALGAALVAAGKLLLSQPWFALRGIHIVGDGAHQNPAMVRANVVPKLRGNFFTLDLQAARRAFEELPWVRRAVVHRLFPNRLRVELQEHQPVAYWGPEGELRLVNSHGEVFDANVGELDRDTLPRLNGPLAQSATMLAELRALNDVLAPLDLAVDQLELSPSGNWRAQLDSGTRVELGSGSREARLARVQAMVQTITQVTARYQRRPEQLATVDLRHRDGYAIRLAGVRTLTASEPAHSKFN